MDIASKYRTRYPPKEHEEAVRMLLEGIAAKQSSRGAADERIGSEYNYDRKSLTSSASSLSDEVALNANVDTSTRMRSKATSTGDSVSTSSGTEARHNEPIPSRTIAVQCDLKSSSAKRGRLFDASLQASSISSTRYGFYSYSPETLESRRKLQRSVSSRDMGHLFQAAKNQDLVNTQIEAPTSMSELSSSSSAIDEDRARNQSGSYGDKDRKFSSSYNSSLEGASKLSAPDHRGAKNNFNQGANRVARARISSLPRRPMTALSYVSTSKLREPRSTSRSGEDSDHVAQPLKNRAMSQQVLSQPQNWDYRQETSSGSESDGPVDGASRYRASPANYQEDRSEEMVILKRVQPQAAKPKSRLVASIHNEEVRDFSTLSKPALKERNLDSRTSDGISDNWAKKSPQLERVVGRDGDITDHFRSFNPGKPPIPPKPEYQGDRHHLSEQENQDDYRAARENIHRLQCMSLSRKPKNSATDFFDRSQAGYNTSSRIPQALSKNTRTSSQMVLNEPSMPYVGSRGYSKPNTRPEVSRSISMRQMDKSNSRQNQYVYNGPPRENMARKYSTGSNDFEPAPSFNHVPNQRLYQGPQKNESDDSESPSTRTWASPNMKVNLDPERGEVFRDRKNTRSYSMRDGNNTGIPRVARYGDSYNGRGNDFVSYSSSSESSALDSAPGFVRSHPLDYDSQYRLNESGLPEVNTAIESRGSDETRSYLRMQGYRATESDSMPHYPTNRSAQIRGRAMSQQSLTRPTMPISSSRRRGGSNPGSDVGGSSMSLVSRLHGRYENAHTRTPVVMYIPQVAPKSSLLGDGKASTIRRSSRAKRKSSSQDRSRKSSLRNGSDSESSSMLRTLVRRRSRQGIHASRRAGRMQNSLEYNDEEEDLDNVGQLATEMDSYKFRRRYSVPKDAKINWFAKLKQRVTSGSR